MHHHIVRIRQTLRCTSAMAAGVTLHLGTCRHGEGARGLEGSERNCLTIRSRTAMSIEAVTSDLFGRWERVWNDGEFDLISRCVAPIYMRHDHSGDRAVTAEACRAELETVRADRPGIRVAVFDRSFKGDRAWYRFEFRWIDPKSGASQTQAGLQAYRIENGKLAETWISLLPVGSRWPDPVAQDTWTSVLRMSVE